jgi:hypothetical protein
MKHIKLLALTLFLAILIFGTSCYAVDYDKIKEGDILRDGSVITLNGEKDLIISTGGEKEITVDGKTNETYIMQDVKMMEIDAYFTKWKVCSVIENEDSIKLIIEPQYDIEVKDLKEGMDIKKGTIIKFPKQDKQYEINIIGTGSGYTISGTRNYGVEIGYESVSDKEYGGGIWPQEIETWRIEDIYEQVNGIIFIGILPAYDIEYKDLYVGKLIKIGSRFAYDSTMLIEDTYISSTESVKFSLNGDDWSCSKVGGLFVLNQNNISNGKIKDDDAKYLRVKSIVDGGYNKKEVIFEPVYDKKIDSTLAEAKESSKNTGIEMPENCKEITNKIIKNEIINNRMSLLEKAMSAGKKLDVEVKIEKIESKQVPENEIKEIEKNINKEDIAQYFSIDLLIKLDGEEIDKIEETGEEIEFTLSIPEELIKEGREFYIIRVHNGKVEKIKSTLENEKLTFKTDKFSTYALAYTDKQEEIIDSEKDETPKTGAVDISLYTCTFVAIACLIKSIKIKNSKH